MEEDHSIISESSVDRRDRLSGCLEEKYDLRNGGRAYGKAVTYRDKDKRKRSG